jgi:hypothetical protein
LFPSNFVSSPDITKRAYPELSNNSNPGNIRFVKRRVRGGVPFGIKINYGLSVLNPEPGEAIYQTGFRSIVGLAFVE